MATGRLEAFGHAIPACLELADGGPLVAGLAPDRSFWAFVVIDGVTSFPIKSGGRFGSHEPRSLG